MCSVSVNSVPINFFKNFVSNLVLATTGINMLLFAYAHIPEKKFLQEEIVAKLIFAIGSPYKKRELIFANKMEKMLHFKKKEILNRYGIKL